jgi:tetratricopeptide (TPR) repeat protein
MTMPDLFRSKRSRRSLGLPHARRRICLAALFLLTASPLLCAQNCTPPESMKAKLQDKPNAAVYNDLGVWFAEKEQYGCAANAFATSLQTEPEQPDLAHVVFMFGVSLYFSGDFKEAIGALQQAEQLGTNEIKIHTILATALDSTHETAGAIAEWRAALAFDPESSTVLQRPAACERLPGDHRRAGNAPPAGPADGAAKRQPGHGLHKNRQAGRSCQGAARRLEHCARLPASCPSIDGNSGSTGPPGGSEDGA